MTVTAAELNGARLNVPGQPEVWLVFFGVRHHIASPATFEALFSAETGLAAIDSVEHMQRGQDLNDGTCLIRADGDTGIYLVTGFPESEIRKHHIPSFETFVHFGFDESKVRQVPALVFAAIPPGRDLQAPV